MKCLLTIWFLFVSLHGFSQDLPPITQQQLENAAGETEEENPEDDNFLQELDQFKKHPVHLNTATGEALRALHFLTDLQIHNFIRYRNLFGKLISVYELQAIPTWDLLTIKKLLPYITINN